MDYLDAADGTNTWNIISWNTQNGFYVSQFNLLASSGTLWQEILVNGWTLANGKTLTILPWVVVKIKVNQSLSISWNLQSKWTNTENIIFTSQNDNSVWESLWTGTPAKWDWQYMSFTYAWTNSSVLD